MKKLLALVLVFAMLSVSAFAATPAEELAEAIAKNSSERNYEVSSRVTITLDKPLGLLSLFDEEAAAGDEAMAEIVDIKGILEDLFGASTKLDCVVDASDDFKKVNMELSADVTYTIENEIMTETVNLRPVLWIVWDFSDEDAPVYKLIIKSGREDRYMVIDFAFGMGDDVSIVYDNIEMTSSILDAASEYNTLAYSAFDVKKNGNTYTVPVTQTGVRDMISGIVKKALGESGEMDPVEIDAALGSINGFFDNVKIFADDAGELRYTFDRSGSVASAYERLSLDFNVVDIAQYFGADMELGEDDPFKYEDFDIAMTVTTESTYKNYGSAKVNVPVLNDENSVDITETLFPTYAWDDDYGWIDDDDGWYVGGDYLYFSKEGTPVRLDGEIAVPMRPMFENWRDVEIAWDKDTKTATFKSDGSRYDEISVTVGSSVVIKDGVEITLSAPIESVDGSLYATSEFIEKVMGGKISYIGTRWLDTYDEEYSGVATYFSVDIE